MIWIPGRTGNGDSLLPDSLFVKQSTQSLTPGMNSDTATMITLTFDKVKRPAHESRPFIIIYSILRLVLLLDHRFNRSNGSRLVVTVLLPLFGAAAETGIDLWNTKPLEFLGIYSGIGEHVSY